MNIIERSWYQKIGVSWLLLPLSILFWLIYIVRKGLFSAGLKTRYKSKLPVIVVGNITVGGNGKTPMVIFLAEYLNKKGYKVAVISRGYGGQVQTEPLLVTHDTDAAVCGDEPKLISERCNIPVIVCPNRTKSIQYIENTLDVDVIISDDGLQHLAIIPSLTVCICDGQRKFGNRLLLPAGPLREPVSVLKHCDLVIDNGGNSDDRYDLELIQYKQVIDDKVLVKGPEQAYLVSAIGNPQRFEKSVKATGVKVIERIDFRDHHNYQARDFKQFNGTSVVMTEKDAVKCRRFAQPNWYYLSVSAKLTEQAQQKLDSALHSIGIK